MILAVFMLVATLTAILAVLIWPSAKGRYRMLQLTKNMPGPHALPLIGCAYQFKRDRKEFMYQMMEWLAQYGGHGLVVVWTGPIPVILLTQANAAEVVLTSSKLLTKSRNYDILEPWLGTGLLTSTGDKWRRRRKMLTPTFHYAILSDFVETFWKESCTLVEVLEPMANSGEVFDIFPFIKRCALDIICQTAMGVSVNAQRDTASVHASNVSYVQAVGSMSKLIFKHERMPWLWWPPVFARTHLGRKYHRTLAQLQAFTRKATTIRQVINERIREQEQKSAEMEEDEEGRTDDSIFGRKKKRAFLDLLLLNRKENELTEEDIREEVDTFMFEGHDTTSSGMGWALFLLGNHPEIQEKARDEVDAVFHNTDRQPTADDLKQLKYVERVIKEALRLFPPVPMFGRKVTEEVKIGEFTLPIGAIVLISPTPVHHQPDIYDRSFEFRPDRWLPENTVGRHPFAFIPFSAGPRNCIGQKFALMEEKAVLSMLLRKYRFESVDSLEENTPMAEVILKPLKGFRMKITHRNDKMQRRFD